jgi:hypothetical protein
MNISTSRQGYKIGTSEVCRNIKMLAYPNLERGTRLRGWFRHYATSRKVAGSIPDEVIGFFNWPNPSSGIMAMGSTRPLTDISTRNLPGGKGRPKCKADNLTAICEPNVYTKCGSLDVSQRYGPSRPVTGIALSFFLRRRSGAIGRNYASKHDCLGVYKYSNCNYLIICFVCGAKWMKK